MAQRQQQQQMQLQMQCHEENNGSIRKSSILAGNPASNQAAGGNAGGSSGGSGVHGPLQNTVFIHKLYNILEDEDLKDLIWWSPSGTSFLIRPTEKFSRALATYFKHTNIASFVRQLNMYGFHKVSNDHSKDVQQQQQQQTQPGPETAGESIKIWEFRHSMGIFKRGDIEGLKLIKRRSSRNIATLNGRKNSASAVSLGPTHPQIEESDAAKQQRSQQQPSVPPAPPPAPPPQQQQWQTAQQRQQSQFIVSAEEEAQQQSQVGLTAYPSSESVFNQQFQQQQLETRFAELCQSYSGLRYEYSNLQYRHDGLLEQLRVMNVDVAKLLDFVQSLVSLQGSNCDIFNEKNLKGDPAKLQQFRQHQHEMTALEQEMQKFKANLMQRFQKNLETLQQQQQHNPSVPQQPPHVLQYGANMLHGHATPSISKDMRPVSGSSIPSNSSAAAAFVPHLFSVPSAPTGAIFQQTGPLISQPDHFSSPRIVMMNPFETTGQSSTVKRNMSILMDPLSSAPNVGGVTVSPSRPIPGTLGSQIPRNPSPLVNSSRPPKQEPPLHTNYSNQQTQINAHTKRTSRISVKDGTFLLKPNKNSTLSTKRSSVNSDCSSRSDSAAMLPTSGSGLATSTVETVGPRDSSAIGLPFRTFYSHGTNGDQAKEDPTKNENLPSRLGTYVTLHNAGSFAPPRSTQTSPKQFELKKSNLEASDQTEPAQQTILSPMPSRSDIQNRRASSGVYSLLNTEAASPRSSTELDTNPKKKTKL
ncbi:hypothetical protein HG536_0A04940 [Torulaspora globosa]|uniref:Heat shock transcription factor n=1 Tax=Torulaspora globosa TaxID=48254 RepID=A0A7G3ZAZ3_9SACH|nr:uncharacterized protein HG536_0A04940 [Torulaspora globosa]QLL30679.1 hypothetical protein HG536_0A04940 [Torulaspora globosa]